MHMVTGISTEYLRHHGNIVAKKCYTCTTILHIFSLLLHMDNNPSLQNENTLLEQQLTLFMHSKEFLED